MPGEWRATTGLLEPSSLSNAERRELITELLRTLLADPDADPSRIHDEVRDKLAPAHFTFPQMVDQPAETERWQAVGRWLCRYGTDVRPVLIGLLLLQRCGTTQDAELVRVLGILPRLTCLAAAVLKQIDAPVSNLTALAECVPSRLRGGLIQALVQIDDPTAAQWLRNHAVGDVPVEPWIARSVAERIDLAAELATPDPDPVFIDQATRLLASMCRDARRAPAIIDYADAIEAITAVVNHARRVTATLPAAAALAALVDAISTGAAARLDWPVGAREQCIDRIIALVRTRPWSEVLDVPDAEPAGTESDLNSRKEPEIVRDRAAWANTVFAREQAAHLERRPQQAQPAGQGTVSHLRLCISAPDPGRVEDEAELRILIDGLPVVSTVFPCGRGRPPRLASGLSTAAEPFTAVLAAHLARPGEAGVVTLHEDVEHAAVCTAKLTVTITRENGLVLWRDWRGVEPSQPTLPEPSFDARQYDTEIARIAATSDTPRRRSADADRTWSKTGRPPTT